VSEAELSEFQHSLVGLRDLCDSAVKVRLIRKSSSVQAMRGFFENADRFAADPIPIAAADLKA
jgi:hypothetical protein